MRGVYYRLYLSLFLLLWRDGNLLRRMAYRIGEDHHADGRRTSSLVVVWCAVGGVGRCGVARGAWDVATVVLGGSRYVYET